MNKKLITLLATLFAGFLGNVKADTFYPSSVANPTSTSTSYCQGASSVAPISTTMTAASCTTATASVTVTYTWFSSNSNSVSTGSAAVVSTGTVSVTSSTPPSIPTCTPDVSSPGPKYYFCQLSWATIGCAPLGTIVPTNPIAITVNSLPTISSSPSNSPVCSGSDLSLSCNPTGGASPYSFSWTGPNSFASMVQDPTRTGVTIADAGAYSVSVTDQNGCTTAASPSATVAVVVNSIATGAASLPVCKGGTISLTSFVIGSWTPTTYSWQDPSGTTISSTSSASISNANLGDAGTYTLTASGGGCTVTDTTKVVVNSIAAAGAPTAVCTGGSLV